MDFNRLLFDFFEEYPLPLSLPVSLLIVPLIMHFQQPTALWFLPLLVVPLILHLVNLRRYKVLPFPNVLTLSRLKEEEQQRNKLKHRLILLSRILALAALILFFAAPTFNPNAQSKPQQYSIFLDNSPSLLLASNAAGDGLQESIQRVRAYIHSLPDEAKIQILTGEFFASDQMFVSKSQALQRLNQIAGGAPSRTISEVIQRQRLSLPDETSPLERLIVSDFQRNMLPFPTATDSLGQISLLPISVEAVPNISIDSVWVASPILLAGTEVEFAALIRNHGTEALEDVQVFFNLSNRELPPVNSTIPPNSTQQISFKARLEHSGWSFGSVYLDADPFSGDNRMDFGFYAGSKIKVFELRGTQATTSFERLFRSDALIDYSVSSESSVSLSSVEGADLILVNGPKNLSSGILGLLKQKSEQGTTVAWVFSKNGQGLKMEQGLNFAVEAMNGQPISLAPPDPSNPFYADVFSRQDPDMKLPRVVPSAKISTGLSKQILLSTEDGLPVVSVLKSTQNAQQHWVFSMDLSQEGNEFVQHPLFVPLALKMAYQATFKALWHFNSDADVVIIVPKSENTKDPVYSFSPWQRPDESWLGLRTPKGRMDELRPGKGNLGPGLYLVSLGADTVGIFGVSLPANESELVFLTSDSLNSTLERQNLAEQFSIAQSKDWEGASQQGPLNLQFWLILFALFFLALEIFWFKMWNR